MLALINSEQNPEFLGNRSLFLVLDFINRQKKIWEDELFHCIPSLDLEPKQNLGGVYSTS